MGLFGRGCIYFDYRHVETPSLFLWDILIWYMHIFTTLNLVYCYYYSVMMWLVKWMTWIKEKENQLIWKVLWDRLRGVILRTWDPSTMGYGLRAYHPVSRIYFGPTPRPMESGDDISLSLWILFLFIYDLRWSHRRYWECLSKPPNT